MLFKSVCVGGGLIGYFKSLLMSQKYVITPCCAKQNIYIYHDINACKNKTLFLTFDN